MELLPSSEDSEDLQISASSEDEKEHMPCSCGDENHEGLKEWWELFRKTDDQITPLFNDKLNKAAVEANVQKLLPEVLVSNGYCPTCHNLLENWPEFIKKVPGNSYTFGSYDQPHFKNTFEFEAGYRNECRLCAMFVQRASQFGYSLELWHRFQNRLNCLGKPTVILINLHMRGGVCMLQLAFAESRGDPKSAVLHCIRNYDQQLLFIGKQDTFLTGKGVSSQLELAHKWLIACSETHESCRSTEGSPLPTRLIDVGSTPIRLVITSNLTTKPRYATLSHCWGTIDFIKLQEDTLENFMTAIPEDQLTKTFRDAIYITRSLGLQYLWIDSLCIIQLSSQEWLRESALMSAVYGGSTINIAAAGALDGTQGCFLKPPNFVGKVQIEPVKGEIWNIAPEQFHWSVSRSPLASRAWALQERLLSPRTLHFSKTELFWDCRHCGASESFPEGLPLFEKDWKFYRGKPVAETWDTIVLMYTTANLTFRKDKLVAIAGIAQHAQKEKPDQYLAGLWRNDIEFQLLWSVLEEGLPKGSEYFAPSWSWASADGACLYYPRREREKYIYLSHVIDARVVPAEKPFGPLVGGVLTMSCSGMLAGKLSKIKHKYSDQYILEIESSGEKGEDLVLYPDSDEHLGQTIYALPILETPVKVKNWRDSVDGLLLLPTGNNKGEYFRVGRFLFYVPSDHLPKTQEWSLEEVVTFANGKSIAEAQCAEILEELEFPGERYVITII